MIFCLSHGKKLNEWSAMFTFTVMIKTSFFSILILFLVGNVYSQEFIVNVQVNAQKLSNQSDRDVLKDLDRSIKEYFEKYRWTDDPSFNPDTRIDLTISLIIENSTIGRKFSGQLFIGASRLIYKTDKPTSLFRYSDKNIEFEYYPGIQLQHNEQTFDPLPSILNYYAYLILGIDADSYDPLAGTVYFSRAHKIATMPGTSENMGWVNEATGESRKLAVDEILDPKYINYRNAFFKYHYDGLDVIHFDPATGLQGVVDGLNLVRDTNIKYPNSLWRRRFFESKYKEIADIFREAPGVTKSAVYDILAKADPSHLSEYESLR